MIEKIKIKNQPRWISPMLATLTEKYFSDPDWIYEEKFDGIRAIVIKNKDKVLIYSRNKNLQNSKFPSLVEVLKKQKEKNFILDGEIVAFEKGITAFSKLQQYKKQKIDVYFYAFDLLHFDKYSLINMSLIDRKKALKKHIRFSKKLKYTPHVAKEGEKYLKKACKKGWEGIIAKQKDSKYISKRTRNWLKFKCSNRQEFLIVGYTQPQRSRVGFGALLIGYYEKGKIRFAGKVGTGYDTQFLKKFSKKLKSLETSRKYLEKLPNNAHFVRPCLVAEIAFTEWTSDGKLRHPRFIGLRHDKKPRSVVREGKKR